MLNTILLSSFLMISPVQMERPCLVLAQGYVESRLNCITCHNDINYKHQKLTNYFKKANVKSAEQLATACLETHSPRLMAAIAIKEGATITSRKGGYKKQYQGAWQVNPKIHGYVSHDATMQALQAECILEDLVKENKGNIKKALNQYGGDITKRKYADNIIKELQNIPKL